MVNYWTISSTISRHLSSLSCTFRSQFSSLTSPVHRNLSTLSQVTLLSVEHTVHHVHQAQSEPITPLLIGPSVFRFPVRAFAITFRISIALLSLICLQIVFITTIKTFLLITEHTLRQLHQHLTGFSLDK